MITYKMIARLPDGTEEVIATGLTLGEVLSGGPDAIEFAAARQWAIAFVQE